VFAYRQAACRARGWPAEATAAVSVMSDESHWLALRDVVGALMKALRPASGPAEEERRG